MGIIRKIHCHLLDYFRYSILKKSYNGRFQCDSIFRMHPNSELVLDKNLSEVRFGKNLYFSRNDIIRVMDGGVLRIGSNFFPNANLCMTVWGETEIGENVFFGPNVMVFDHNHDYKADGGVSSQIMKKGKISIGSNVWIGAGCIILSGTEIEDNVVIAAGSIVNGRVPSNNVYIQRRQSELKGF